MLSHLNISDSTLEEQLLPTEDLETWSTGFKIFKDLVPSH